ncbi:MAG: hypothetical protein INR62_04560 [Rhodospirillales bacterium]|nr:hypothetical protein [Acetobacter sp.]
MSDALAGYFDGAVGHLLERTRYLRSIVPRDLKAEFYTLHAVCRDALDAVVTKLDDLREGSYSDPRVQTARLREYRRIVDELDEVENAVVAALTRNHRDDLFLNRLVGRMVGELSYPLVPPVVTCLSQEYYRIYPHFNLLCVPLAEARFLLHLPDLYHELGHAMLSDGNHPDAVQFQTALDRARMVVQGYLAQQQSEERLARSPASLGDNLILWEECWLKSWLSEFFCDLFALYALGPAFAWSHFHLSAKRTHDPLAVPPYGGHSHPCDEARTGVMLHALALLGYTEEARQIREKWEVLSAMSSSTNQPEYNRCFPDHLLESIAEEALAGYQASGCLLATQCRPPMIQTKFSEAWERFWNAPMAYATWEAEAVQELRASCASC